MSVRSGLPLKWDREADVVVVGYGGAGAVAAVEAHDLGAAVLILDKASSPGGCTVLSGGIFYAADSFVQKAQGITDSADDMFRYWSSIGKGFNEQELVRLVSNNSSEIIQWLSDLGVIWQNIAFTGSEELPEFKAVAQPKPRGHFSKGGGAMLYKRLTDAVETRGIEVMLGTSAKRLLTDENGEVMGVEAESSGKEICIKARRGVILASGGFGNNREMIRLFKPKAADKGVLGSAKSSMGDGHRMAMAIGASVRGMSELCASLGVNLEYSVAEHSLPPRLSGTRPYIFVNERGVRFVDETLNSYYVSYRVSKQEFAYLIFDADALKNGLQAIFPAFQDVNTQIQKGKVITAATIGELAAKIGILEPARLENTVNDWNRYVKADHDPEFGRGQTMLPIQSQPFYASEVVPYIIGTAGGLAINKEMQVMHVEGHAIPRLYAAGEIAGGIIGAIYPGSGSDLQMTICTGRIAGKNAASESSRE